MDFFHALASKEIPFLLNAVLVGIFGSISFGVVGSYVVVRRISYIAGAVAHSALGGIGAALYMQYELGYSWIHPLYGALVAALISALIIGGVSLYSKQREDTIIGTIWAMGMAIGLLFIARTSGYVDPMSYLFGNILLLTRQDVWLVIGLNVIVLGITIVFYNRLLAVCFDEEFLSIKGIDSKFYYFLLLCMTALTVVLMVQIVGIVLVIALLTLPPAISGIFSRRLWQMMTGSVLVGMVFTFSGIAISYQTDLPSGPVIIVLTGSVYLAGMVLKSVLK